LPSSSVQSPAPRSWLATLLARLLLLVALIAVLAGGLWRWHYLEGRPLHADEAVQAWQTWQLLRGEGYRYDPVDRHGPWLYYGAAALERVRGGDATTWNDRRARTFIWLAGLATLALVAIAAARFLGPLCAAFATTLLAVSPLAVLYHTYFVQEAWLALFTWALLFAGLAWLERPRLSLALAIGAAAGLMQVTKETSILHFAAIAAAWLVAARTSGTLLANDPSSAVRRQPDRLQAGSYLLRHFVAAAGVALLIYVLFYSGFGQNPRGLLDGLLTYFHQWQRSSDADHRQPFLHYVQLFLPHRNRGVPWGEPALLAFGLAGLLISFRRGAPPAAHALAVFTFTLLLIYSAIPYKTPWLMLTPIIGLVLLAAHGLGGLARIHRWGFVLAFAGAITLAGQSINRTRLSLERYPGDERNPYFYQQAPRGFQRLVDRVHELRAALGRDPIIAVVSPDYAWPVPWYLRDFASTGYFTSPPDDLSPFEVLIWDTQVEPPDEWPADAVIELHGLRPNVLLYVSISRPLWQQWEAQR
jgi:uncharacterized protein (TIGR03663 family)